METCKALVVLYNIIIIYYNGMCDNTLNISRGNAFGESTFIIRKIIQTKLQNKPFKKLETFITEIIDFL